jgi:hypothetical protein
VFDVRSGQVLQRTPHVEAVRRSADGAACRECPRRPLRRQHGSVDKSCVSRQSTRTSLPCRMSPQEQRDRLPNTTPRSTVGSGKNASRNGWAGDGVPSAKGWLLPTHACDCFLQTMPAENYLSPAVCKAAAAGEEKLRKSVARIVFSSLGTGVQKVSPCREASNDSVGPKQSRFAARVGCRCARPISSCR